jgi:hypothetical protein
MVGLTRDPFVLQFPNASIFTSMYVATRLLPKSVRLRSLTIHHSDNALTRFPEFMKQNGSIHHLDFATGDGSDWDAKMEQMQAYCERNRRLPELLGSDRQNRVADDVDANHRTSADFSMFPDLFAAALPTPRTGPNAFLSGLLTSNEVIGWGTKSTRDAKRARGEDEALP